MTWRPLQTVRTRQRRPRHHVTAGAVRAEGAGVGHVITSSRHCRGSAGRGRGRRTCVGHVITSLRGRSGAGVAERGTSALARRPRGVVTAHRAPTRACRASPAPLGAAWPSAWSQDPLRERSAALEMLRTQRPRGAAGSPNLPGRRHSASTCGPPRPPRAGANASCRQTAGSEVQLCFVCFVFFE